MLGQLVAAEGGLAAPDREQNISRHAELLLDRGERAAVLGAELLGLFGKPRDIRFLEVVGRRLHELGLSARRRALPARKIEIGQRQIGLDPAGRGIKCTARNSHALRLRPQISEPLLKQRIRGRHRRRGGGRPQPEREAKQPIFLQSTHCSIALSIGPSTSQLEPPGRSPARHRSLATIRPQPALTGTAKKRRRYGVFHAAGAARNRLP